MGNRPRIVILGGGFAGVYTAIYLEKLRKGHNDFDVCIVNRENYFVFQPMLPEIVSGTIGMLDTVSPIRRLAPHTDLYVREVESVDLVNQTVTLSHGVRPRPQILPYDHLVIGLGNVTDFRGMVGLHEHALPFKNLVDAVNLRNHLIHVLEEADTESDPDLQRELLTFVVAGGGFSGVEVAAELNDFVRRVARSYPQINPAHIRVQLLHSGERILERELSPSLSLYAQKLLRKRGVEFRFKTRLAAASPEFAVTQNGERIATRTLISTVPSSPHPLIETLDLAKVQGKLKTGRDLLVEGTTHIWAAGDCAYIPTADGTPAPPTAQHAIREAKVIAHNIVAELRGGTRKTFDFKGLGKMGALGHHSAVAEVFDRFQISGLPAWIMWRSVYWAKLPGFDRKLRVGLSWLLDLLIPPEMVQLKLGIPRGISQAHYEPGEAIFHQGDMGDCLYIIVRGEADVLLEHEGQEVVLACLGAGEYFGEMALLNQKTRNATVRCKTPMDVLVLPKGDLGALVSHFPALQQSFDSVMAKRSSR
jgi:NADH dehydrogenase